MVLARAAKGAALLATLTILALSHGVGGAVAQGKGTAQPQAATEQTKPDLWFKLCSDVAVPEPVVPGEPPKQKKPEEMKKVNVCLTQADVRDNTTLMLVGKLVIRQIAGQPKPQIMVMLPLQSALRAGALVKLDDKESIKLVYTVCDRAGCYAESAIEPAMIDQMKSGKQIAFAGMDVTGRSLAIPLTLEGFAKAIDGPPMPMQTYVEQQRKIAEIINAKLAELRKKQEEAAQNAQVAAPAQSNKKGK
ncbi:MAG: invasion associated locus B family protein [Rhodomicrobium sp.]